ncbi:uncharacterized protein LOC111710724 isoform X2 [Eurytemora carolleeae]|uniref:uncharacterized protein LOC111710724 isoform X2 n=1 Tax=Eurytemora carolleeae TaxID=1294199 RepID=UPI000C763BAD|nr:uncharacterized protein LOC111710724 isoform X2 [Eurytemora carolleeae]|eukprot:XP_023340610.1 uncharacterized protein LOC111710724 isoform X2 [Eurytemora affinis]
MGWKDSTLLLLLIYTDCVYSKGGSEYWSEDYDTSKNCKDEQTILKIMTSGNSSLGHCEDEVGDLSDVQVFQSCKFKLAKAVATACSSTTVKDGGKLLYCKNNKLTTCCYHQHKCVENWNAIKGDYTKTAEAFLRDKKAWLENEKSKGYETCQALDSSYDASVCQKDCTSQETSDFAKQCSAQGGFFKCCIRRDKANCHECRYCCTLLMCTRKIGSGFHTDFTSLNGTKLVVDSQSEGIQQAKELFFTSSSMWKLPDYRCLNPESDPDPLKWGHYDPFSFSEAITKEELSKAVTFPYDKRFMNFEDPEVVKEMLDTKELEKKWKEVYGFDFAHLGFDGSERLLDCVKAESSEFAKKCKKNKGFFKCCSNAWNLYAFVESRKILKDLNLITSFEEIKGCTSAVDCFIETNVHFCSILDQYTGLVELEFETPIENPLGGTSIVNAERQHRIKANGTDLRLGHRASFCAILDTCTVNDIYFTNISAFMQVYDKEAFCNLDVKDIIYSDNFKAEDPQQCQQRKYPNVRICPKEEFLKKPKGELGVVLFGKGMEKLWKGSKKSKDKKKKSKKKKKKKGKKKKNKKKKKKRKKKKKKKD